MDTRIYLVSGIDTEEMGGERRLVEANSAAQAIRHVVRQKYNAKAASPKEVADLMMKKVAVEKAALESAPSSSAECP